MSVFKNTMLVFFMKNTIFIVNLQAIMMTAFDSQRNSLANPPFANDNVDKLLTNNNNLKSIPNMSSQSFDTAIVYNTSSDKSKEDICTEVEIGIYDECIEKSFKSIECTYENIEDAVHKAKSLNENKMVKNYFVVNYI